MRIMSEESNDERTQIIIKMFKSLGIIMHHRYQLGLLSKNDLVQTFTKDVFKASYLISLRHKVCIYKVT